MQPARRHIKLFIVEDEFLIADQVAKTFASLGVEVIGFAATTQKALEVISRGTSFTVAILDVRLRDGTVFAVADLIVKSGATVVFYTALDAKDLPERFRAMTVVQKPEDLHVLYSAMLKARNLPIDSSPGT